ncbi:MAG TPA: hypothetical protein VN688_09430 [Gemmataceae bacterium]|nr:hypothetical protein [Gemmataceae bacterium]
MPDGDKSQSHLPGPALAAIPPEALLVCPECRLPLPSATFETHLRQVHRIYQFRGVRRSFNDTFAALLDAFVIVPPDAEAWRTLAAIASENQGPRAEVFLATTLAQLLLRVSTDRRTAVVEALGTIIGRSGATSLAVMLASDAETLAHQLSLIVIANLPQPLDAVLIPPLRGLLLDRHLPVEAQLRALAAVLQTAGTEGILAEELLQTLVKGLGKAKSIKRLRRFERLAGKNPLVDALCGQIEDKLRMSCPRCSMELRRPKMIEHLWSEHRLVLDGRRVREPWAMIEEWTELYLERRDPELLDRCRTLVQRLDPEEGPQRLNRLLLTQGIADEDARRGLTAEAAERHAACCPWCFGMVPVPREVPPLLLNRYHGRLSAGGYRIEVSEHGLRTSLEIVTPTARIYHGRELGQLWTRRGAMIIFVGPLILLALAWGFGLIGFGIKPLRPVAVILLVALLVHLLVRWLWRPRLPVDDRARNYAWTLLAPRLHADGYRIEDSAFLAGLAKISVEDGYAPLRAALLPDLLKRTENALSVGLAPPGHLAALYRLTIEDAVWRGADPVPRVVDLLTRCFEGRLSLLFAEHLLAEWRTSWWSAGNLTRLRVLLCDRAFEAGFEVRNLLDAGLTAPALGAVLNTADVAGLASLRLLWSLRPTRPWDRCGDPLTVFDLAADRKRAELLARYPDLLLWQEEADWLVAAPGVTDPKPAQILFCVRGVLLQDILFTETPRVVEVNARWRYSDLVIGDQRFRSAGHLDGLALRMERWFRYAFSEFLPALPNVEKWKAPDRIAILRAWGAVTCPQCQRSLLPRVGQVGIALSEDDKGLPH